ncbi:hypothetical protein Tco_0911919 [Tanacetum coccineum]
MASTTTPCQLGSSTSLHDGANNYTDGGRLRYRELVRLASLPAHTMASTTTPRQLGLSTSSHDGAITTPMNQWAGGGLEEVPLLVEVHILGATNPLSKMSKLDRFLKRSPGDDSNCLCRNLCGKFEAPQQVNKAQASEVAQKAKIKWYVEGDENTKFFHGMLNKKRLISPPIRMPHIDMPFPNSLSTDQQKDLECMVSKEEVKRAVWDCGTDKSPGPDGFTFGFYRHFCRLLKTMFLRR